MNCPCHECKARFLGCHGQCERYSNYRQIIDNAKDRMLGERLARDFTISQAVKASERIRKKGIKRGKSY